MQGIRKLASVQSLRGIENSNEKYRLSRRNKTSILVENSLISEKNNTIFMLFYKYIFIYNSEYAETLSKCERINLIKSHFFSKSNGS